MPVAAAYQGRGQPLMPGGQDKNISSTFPHFPVFSLIYPQIFFIFFLILACPGYAYSLWTTKKTSADNRKLQLGCPYDNPFYFLYSDTVHNVCTPRKIGPELF